MTRHVLILTPSLGFGELIRQFFEDTGGFAPVLHANPAQALDDARQQAFDLTILDADFSNTTIPELARALRGTNSGMRLIAIPVEDRPDDPQLAQLQADQVLPSPFYLPDLMSALEGLYGSFVPRDVRTLKGGDAGQPPRKPTRGRPQTPPEWLGDVSLAAQYLTRLSLESAAQAALITRGQDVWAYAGELPQPAAEELASELARHWENASADLARFVHLKATGSDYMLYATSLGGDYILAMVFDAEMPFSQMRVQASEMAEALAVAPRIEMTADSTKETPAIHREDAHPSAPDDEHEGPADDFEPELTRAQAPGLPQDKQIFAANADVEASALEAAAASNYDLHYTYIMIPRLPSHRLEGDLAERLAHWMPQLCLAFGWRLDTLNVQPDFMLWTISIAPDMSPDAVANTLDKYLSERIFEEFPPLKRDNPSGMFWAPGFLILSGAIPGDSTISKYIQQTRRRQGVPRSR